jgi:hypothetical protein
MTLRTASGRGRSHEYHLHGWTNRGAGRGLGRRRGVFWRLSSREPIGICGAWALLWNSQAPVICAEQQARCSRLSGRWQKLEIADTPSEARTATSTDVKQFQGG